MKGYWMIIGTAVTDAALQQEYGMLWAPIAEAYGARVIRGERTPVRLEGRADSERLLLVEFPSLEKARACYDSPEYQAAKAVAQRASTRDLILFEGDLG